MSIDTERPEVVTAPVQETIRLEYPGLSILVPDDGSTSVRFNGVPATLKTHWWRLLRALAERPGEPLTDEYLLSKLYPEGEEPAGRDIVKVYMSHLRHVLDTVNARHLIQTVRAGGYILLPPDGHERSKEAPRVTHTIIHNNVKLEVDEHRILRIGDQVVVLAPGELEIFLLLLNARGKIVSKEAMYEAIYDGYPTLEQPTQKILDVRRCKIVGKLVQANPQLADLIETVWGRGYKMGQAEPLPDEDPPGFVARPHVVVPMFGKLTLSDLPSPTCRWVIGRKAIVVHLVNGNVLSLERLLARYPDLTPKEFERWKSVLADKGTPGLRVTHGRRYT